MERDERIERLHQFVRQLITAGTSALNSIDMLQLGIPEGQEMARALEAFDQAMETSKDIARYLNACEPIIVGMSVAMSPRKKEDRGESARACLSL
jgi:hypothetical protein